MLNKNEVSARSCMPLLIDLRLFVDVGDFAAILRGTVCFDCRSGRQSNHPHSIQGEPVVVNGAGGEFT